jgi:hypothetical protein
LNLDVKRRGNLAAKIWLVFVSHGFLCSLVLGLFVELRKCVEANAAIEAAIRSHAEDAKEIFFDCAMPV